MNTLNKVKFINDEEQLKALAGGITPQITRKDAMLELINAYTNAGDVKDEDKLIKRLKKLEAENSPKLSEVLTAKQVDKLNQKLAKIAAG